MVGIFFLLVLLTLILVFWPRKTREEELAGSAAKKVGKTIKELQFSSADWAMGGCFHTCKLYVGMCCCKEYGFQGVI